MNGDTVPGNGVAKQILEPLLFLSAVYREPSIPRLPAALTLGKNKAVAQILDMVPIPVSSVICQCSCTWRDSLFSRPAKLAIPHLRSLPVAALAKDGVQ